MVVGRQSLFLGIGELTLRNEDRLLEKRESSLVNIRSGAQSGFDKPPGNGAESEPMPHQAVYYKAEDETGGRMDIEGRRKNKDLKLAHLLHFPNCFTDRLVCWVPREYPQELGIAITG